MKFVSITHSERNIWNGPTVATAISWEKRKPVLEGNGFAKSSDNLYAPCTTTNCAINDMSFHNFAILYAFVHVRIHFKSRVLNFTSKLFLSRTKHISRDHGTVRIPHAEIH